VALALLTQAEDGRRLRRMDVLVVDIGGSRVKMLASTSRRSRRFNSGEQLKPDAFVKKVLRATKDWKYDVISLGYPGAVDAGGVRAEPGHLGEGWVAFDFEAAFGKPVRVVNDAVMQALGGYEGGRMLFIGLGTGLGTTLVTEHVVIPLELGCLPYNATETMADRLSTEGLETYGRTKWLRALTRITCILRESFSADYVVLGGGNVTHVDQLPPATRRGGNDDAFTGGFRLWEEVIEPHDREPPPVWRVVR
jgi:polyphosphate glucokinase